MRQFIDLVESAHMPDQQTIKKAAQFVLSMSDDKDFSYRGAREAYLEEIDDEQTDPESLSWDDPAIKGFLPRWAEARVLEALHNVEHLVRGGSVVAYRMITAAEDFKPDADWHPGIHWSWEEGRAEAYDGNYGAGHVDWLITARIPEASINWPITLGMLASPDYEDENELRLHEDAEVEVLSVERQ